MSQTPPENSIQTIGRFFNESVITGLYYLAYFFVIFALLNHFFPMPEDSLLIPAAIFALAWYDRNYGGVIMPDKRAKNDDKPETAFEDRLNKIKSK